MRFSIVTLVAVLGLLAAACDGDGSGAAEEKEGAPLLDPETIWILDAEHGIGAEIRTAPDGESMPAHCWTVGREPGASVVVFALTATYRSQESDGAVAAWYEPGDWRAYRATGTERETSNGRWREFRRLDGEEGDEAIRAASLRRGGSR